MSLCARNWQQNTDDEKNERTSEQRTKKQQQNEEGREQKRSVSTKFAHELNQLNATFENEVHQISDILDEPLNAGKTVTTLYTHCEESVSPLSHPTLQASESELAQELARGLEEQVECKLKRQLCNATIKGSVPTAIVDTGASASCVKPIDEQPTVSECGRFKLSGNIFTKSGVKSAKTVRFGITSLSGTEVPRADSLNPSDMARREHSPDDRWRQIMRTTDGTRLPNNSYP